MKAISELSAEGRKGLKKLLLSDEHSQNMKAKLEIEHTTFIGMRQEKFLSVKATSAAEVKLILKAMPSTQERFFTGLKKVEVCSPYHFALDTGHKGTRLKIFYTSNDVKVRIEADPVLVKKFIQIATRKLYDSEISTYYTGDKQAHKYQIHIYEWKEAQIRYYGGQITLADSEECKRIIQKFTQ